MPAIATMAHPQQSLLGMHGTQQHLRHAPVQPLRRAVYIHVSDLISAYNIDHVKLEQELDRVKTDRDGVESMASKANSPRRSSGASIGSGSNKQGSNTSGGSHSSMGGVPTELDARDHQKRLQPPRGGHNMVLLVGKIKIVVDKRRVDGSRVRLAEVSCGDETGIVSLRARDDQIDIAQAVAQIEGAVVLRNCTIELYQGKHIRLAVTKWGKLSAYPDHVASTPPPPSKMNRDRNFSLIDLSVVANETSAFLSVSMHSINENQHQLQQNASYHRQHSESQQQQHKFGNKNRNKQSTRKQLGSSTPGNIVPSMQYQVVDHGPSSSAALRYNPHLVSSAQGSLHAAAYPNAGGYVTHPSHQVALVPHPGMAHFQYLPHPPRQVTESQQQHTHHQQQQHTHHQQQMMFHHQLEMQHRQMQMYPGRQQQQPTFHDIGKQAYLTSGVRQLPTPNSRQYAPHQRQQNQSHQRLAFPSSQQIQPVNSEDGSASLGKMNPKAAAYDPGQRNRNLQR